MDRPELKTRLLSAIRKQPSLLPSIATGLTRSGIYKVRWMFNKLAHNGPVPMRSVERYERVRSQLIEKWLDRTTEAHRHILPQSSRYIGPTTTALDLAVRNMQRWRDRAAWGGRDNPVQQLVGRALSPMQQLAGRALRLRCQLFDAMLGSLAWARVVFLIALRRTARAAAGSWWQLRGRMQLSF
jgi:hypothetical protein